MFDAINLGGGGREGVPHSGNGVDRSHFYATGAKIETPGIRYLLDDGTGEVEVDQNYIDYLKSEDGIVYDGMLRDTYNNKVYRYFLK